MRIGTKLAVAAIAAAFSHPAAAGVLYTPPIWTTEWVECAVANVGNKPREIVCECNSGLSVNCPQTQPGDVCWGAGAPYSGPAYCKITVKGPKSAVRGSIRTYNSTNDIVLTATAQ